MALSAALVYKDPGTKKMVWCFKLTASGSYPTGGDTIDLSGLIPVGNTKLPDSVAFEGTAGYGADYVPGASIAAGKVKFYSAAGTEHTAATYNAAISGAANLKMTVVIDKF